MHFARATADSKQRDSEGLINKLASDTIVKGHESEGNVREGCGHISNNIHAHTSENAASCEFSKEHSYVRGVRTISIYCYFCVRRNVSADVFIADFTRDGKRSFYRRAEQQRVASPDGCHGEMRSAAIFTATNDAAVPICAALNDPTQRRQRTTQRLHATGGHRSE